jgi:hypothetical protein
MADWREDWEARFSALLLHGLPARLAVDLFPARCDGEPGLWVVNIHPLTAPDLWAPRDFGWTYHVSIAHEGAITEEEVLAIRASFDGREMTLRFGERHGGYLPVVGELGCQAALCAAHARCWYADRPLHVSM